MQSSEDEFKALTDNIVAGKKKLDDLAAEAQHSNIGIVLQRLERKLTLAWFQFSWMLLTGTERDREDLLNWLSTVRPRDHHDFAKKNRTPGTGSWLFQKKMFQHWIEGPTSSTLWLYGKGMLIQPKS